jgi:hypothetical protein
MYTQDDFAKALEHFDAPQESDWEKVTTSDGLDIYRRLKQDSAGLHEYMVRGILLNVPPEIVHDTFVDLDYRREWDNYKDEHLQLLENVQHPQRDRSYSIVETQIHDQGKKNDAIYWVMEYPWPMSSRDYIVARESRHTIHNQQPTWIVLQAVDPTSSHPEQPQMVRVDEYTQEVIIQPAPEDALSTFIHYKYYENPKGSVPVTVYNWALTQGIPAWINKFKRACKDYGNRGLKKESVDGAKELENVLNQSLEKAFAI